MQEKNELGAAVVDEPADANEQMVVCACGHEFAISKETLVERPYETPGLSNVTQVALICPQCQADTHCYYDAPKLRQFQARLAMALKEFQRARTKGKLNAYRKAKRRYQAEFDRFQIEVREVGNG